MEAVVASAALSGVGAYLSHNIIKEFSPVFVQRRLCGVDQCKKSRKDVPEPMGVVTSSVYLILMFAFIPVPFRGWLMEGNAGFPCHKLVELLSALLTICCTILLGFADDMLDLRWRHKLLFPTLSSLPLLVVYYANSDSTTVAVPSPLTAALGNSVDIGAIYYVYMVMMVVFCTNAINILAGINGLEAGQSLVIALSVVAFNLLQLYRLDTQQWYHCLSLYFLLPFVATTAVLLYHNWWPADVFVGDTFCYFAGATLAVVGVLGHFSKTLALFFVPQLVNFVYSMPQVFRLLPCPRHRLPRYVAQDDRLTFSVAEFKSSEVGALGRLAIRLLSSVGLLHERSFSRDDEPWTQINNMTIINLALKFLGPMHERSLTKLLLVIQVCCSLLAFGVRFGMASLVYDSVR